MSEGIPLIFFVNGKKVIEKEPDPQWTLLYYLRNKLLLCGTKLGCGEGGCGACTVMISIYDRKECIINHLAINACLAPVCSMHGIAVTTVEGIGSTKTKLHPVQERIAKSHGTQCGFCTPGFVMSMYTLLRNSPLPKMKDLEKTFQGNLCRCTGYRPIVDGFQTFTEEWELMQNGKWLTNQVCQMGDKCCKVVNGYTKYEENLLVDTSTFVPYDSSQEPIFPPELKLYNTLDRQELTFKGKLVTWHRPTSLEDLLKLKTKYPKGKIVNGNTEIGVEVKYKHHIYPILLHSARIPELADIHVRSSGIRFGSAVTLASFAKYLSQQIQLLPEHETRIFVAIIDMLHWFGGEQIRNVATVCGNIVTASPISDLCPILVAAGAVLEISSAYETRKVVMNESFFTGYRTTILHDDEVLISITIPYSNKNQHFHAYKQARRRDDDTAIVNSAVNVLLGKDNVVNDFIIVFGGMGPTVTVPRKICAEIIGRIWNEETLNWALQSLAHDLYLPPDAPGGMIQYRRSLTLSFLFRTYLTIIQNIASTAFDVKNLSGLQGFYNQTPKSSQMFHIHPSSIKTDTVGKPIPHISAFRHATGEAVYCDDIPAFKNELYMAVVLSTRAHANFTMDASDALQMEGVHLFLSAKDLPHERNCIGPKSTNAVFVERTVTSQGQILGVVIAENQRIAQSAARKVKVIYEDLQPVIISIEDAIKHKSYFTDITNPCIIERGNVDEIFKSAPHIIHGEMRSGSQEHFYLETQSTVVVPQEDDGLEVYCSTQYPDLISNAIGHSLNIPMSKVAVIVKRLGGGFGGKEMCSGCIAIPAALAAKNLGCPVRCMFDRDEDMLITGGRHPFYIKYKTAFDDFGKILATEVYLYSNGGYSSEFTAWVTLRAIIHFPNAYNISNIRAFGYMCKTNTPSNLAMRGFGAPQGMLASENMIREIAEFLNVDPLVVARINLFEEGNLTFYNQVMENCTLSRCWDECLVNSNFSDRKSAVDTFNRENRWKKRGITMVPTAFSVGYGVASYHYASALLHVYVDGSVYLTHGGVEMGQGLQTKMIQVASKVLQIPCNKIYTGNIATDKIPNLNGTSASISSDYNGMAVLNACEIMKSRLEPYRKANPKGRWEDWIQAANLDGVNLSTTGFYKNSAKEFDWNTMTGIYSDYFTMGVACTEVEIDCLTGDHQIIKTDIVMDVGESLNPAIDIGQIEGAFMQGYGLFMLEEIMFAPDGTMLTKGPGSYKLPTLSNIPIEFNVALLKGAPNPKAIYSSKAIGEPPLFLSSSVFFAVREAIKAARKDAGVCCTDFKLFAPATSAVIRLACEDHLTKMLGEPEPGTPWNVRA